jgi:LysM repeat protein
MGVVKEGEKLMRLVATALAVVGTALVGATTSHVAYAATPTNTNENVNSQAAKDVVIAPGDYMYKIAVANGSTVQRLYDANTYISNPDLIFPGKTMHVPAADEQLAHREMPSTSVAAKQSVAAESEAPAPVATPAPAPAKPVEAPAPRVVTPAAPVRTTTKTTTSAAPTVVSGSVWDRIAACESGGNWSINTGNGFYGGLQFTLSSWRAVGGTGYPNEASREEQILRGQKLQALQGWGAWPVCSVKAGV